MKLQDVSKGQLTKVVDKFYCKLRDKHPVLHRVARKCRTAILPPAIRPPASFMIEILNVCNLHCRMCPQHSKDPAVAVSREKGLMDINLFKKIIDDIPQQNTFVSTIGAGEPLLHPKLTEMVQYAKEKGHMVHTITNGELLTPEMSEKLLNAGLDVIGISIDGAIKTTHEKIRKGSNFERVVSNVDQLIKLKSRLRSSTPLIRIMMVEMDENKSELNDVINRWLPVVDEIYISTQRINSGRHLRSNSDPIRRSPCLRLWQTMVIGWNGKVGLCCDDWAGEMILGDTNTTSIRDIWFGKMLQEIRRYHLKGKYEKVPICANCDSWMEGIPFISVKENGRIIKQNPYLRVYTANRT